MGPYFSVRDTNKIRDHGYTTIHFLSTGTKQPLFTVDLGE